MMEGAFYQPKRTSPTAIAVVVLMHGAGLTALALAKGEMLRPRHEPPIVVDSYPEEKIPPEVAKPTPDRPAQRPTETSIDRPRPIEDIGLVPVFTGPVGPPPMPFPPGPVVAPPADPPPIPDPPKARKVEPARARANLASYVSDEDYPSAAVRNEEQGTTRFRLGVGPDGRVTDCRVTGSSGSSALDSATCRLMKSRARFAPARDSDGRPASDSVSSAIRWVLPD
jgi:periplasmic protein TonB